MYNFKFREAKRQFFWLKQKYKDHPLPYFLMGMNEWLKANPEAGNEEGKRGFARLEKLVGYLQEELGEG